MVETRAPALAVSTKLERIATLAKEKPGVALTTLAHHIDLEWMREAYRRTRKDGATGVDGQSADEYAQRLEENLVSLLNRAKSGDHYWVFAHVTPDFDKSGAIAGYHSFRRSPEASAVAVIKPIYDALSVEEKRHANPRNGTEASSAMLHALLANKGMSYDQFVLGL